MQSCTWAFGLCFCGLYWNFKEKKTLPKPNQHGAGLRSLCFSGILWHVGICLHSRCEDRSLKANIYKAKRNQCTWTFETLNKKHRLDSKTNQHNAGLRHLHFSGVLWTVQSFLIGPFHICEDSIHWRQTLHQCTWTFETLNKKHRLDSKTNQHNAGLRHLHFSGVLRTLESFLSRCEDSTLKTMWWRWRRGWWYRAWNFYSLVSTAPTCANISKLWGGATSRNDETLVCTARPCDFFKLSCAWKSHENSYSGFRIYSYDASSSSQPLSGW